MLNIFQNKDIHFFAKLSIFTAILTILLKSFAYVLTGSVGLLSDALESFINLATAIVTLIAVKIAQEPEDDEHQFGHFKIEYFSSLTEGFFIFIAGICICLTGLERVLHPMPISDIDIGIIISIIASIANGFTAFYMFQAGKKFNSIALQADAHHLTTDIYTTIGIIIGITVAYFTGFLILDSLIAIFVGLNIIYTSINILKNSFHGLMDSRMPSEHEEGIKNSINQFLLGQGLKPLFQIKTRCAGQVFFIYLYLGIPNNWDIKKSHDLTKNLDLFLECSFQESFKIKTFIHIEPESDFLHDF